MSENIVPVPDNVNIVQNENDTPINQAGSGMSKIFHIDECSDHGIPNDLETLKSSLIDPTDLDLTVVVLYVLTVETGFSPLNVNIPNQTDRLLIVQRPNKLIEMPLGWKDSEGTYKMSFNIPSIPQLKCNLVCSKTMGFLSVIMFCCQLSVIVENYSMLINPSEYVECQVFKNLKNLSISFKNQISLPIRCKMLNMLGLDDGILALPDVVLYKIFDYLDANEFVKLTSTCRRLYDTFSNDCVVWRKLCNRDFPEFHDNGESGAVQKNTYKTLKFKKRSPNFILGLCPRPLLPDIFPPRRNMFY